MIKYIMTRTDSTTGDTFVWKYTSHDAVKQAFDIELKNLERWHNDNKIEYSITKSQKRNIATITVPHQHHIEIITLAYMPIRL